MFDWPASRKTLTAAVAGTAAKTSTINGATRKRKVSHRRFSLP